MKIEIKLNANQALQLDNFFQKVVTSVIISNEAKSAMSICYDIQDKTDRLASKIKRASCDRRKSYKMTLKFHEAYICFECLRNNSHATNENLYLQQVHDILHQKLA